MSANLIIIETESGLSEFSEKLKKLASEKTFDTLRICSYEDFKDDKTLGEGDGMAEARIVYLGSKSDVPKIDKWHHEQFGCRIGFEGNKCVIRASNFDLPYRDYNAFREYCKMMKEYFEDVIVPPKNVFTELKEHVGNLFGDEDNQSALRAQYTTLLYEFDEKWLIPFMNGVIYDDDAFKSVDDMASKAHAALAGFTATAAAVCAVPIPFADAPMLISTQIAMLSSIAAIFKIPIDRDGLKSLVLAVLLVGGAVQIGRMAVANLLKLTPVKGWIVGGAVSAATASVITLAMGKAFIEFCKDIKAGKMKLEDLLSKEGRKMFAKSVKKKKKESEKKEIKNRTD